MACEKRERTGECGHFQCPHSGETEHGFECVEIFGPCCEAGLDCLEKCDYSFTEDERDRIEQSNKVVRNRYPEGFAVQLNKDYNQWYPRTKNDVNT